MLLTPPRQARLAAGYTDAGKAAKALRMSRSYLLHLERVGGWPLIPAERAAQLYGADLKIFLLRTPGRWPEGKSAKRAGRSHTARPAGKRENVRR